MFFSDFWRKINFKNDVNNQWIEKGKANGLDKKAKKWRILNKQEKIKQKRCWHCFKFLRLRLCFFSNPLVFHGFVFFRQAIFWDPPFYQHWHRYCSKGSLQSMRRWLQRWKARQQKSHGDGSQWSCIKIRRGPIRTGKTIFIINQYQKDGWETADAETVKLAYG